MNSFMFQWNWSMSADLKWWCTFKSQQVLRRVMDRIVYHFIKKDKGDAKFLLKDDNHTTEKQLLHNILQIQKTFRTDLRLEWSLAFDQQIQISSSLSLNQYWSWIWYRYLLGRTGQKDEQQKNIISGHVYLKCQTLEKASTSH